MNESSQFADNPYQSPRESRPSSSPRTPRSAKSTKHRVFVFSSIRWLGITLSTLFALVGIASLIVILLRIEQSQLYETMLDGRKVDIAAEQSVLQQLQIVNTAQLLLVLASAVMFITWFYNAYVNLRPLGANRLNLSPGWAIGSWFLPIVSLYQPYFIAKDVWIYSAPFDVGKVGGSKPRDTPVTIWWLLCVSLAFADCILFCVANLPDAIDHESLLVSALGNARGAIGLEVVRILAVLAAIQVVLTVSRWQDLRHKLMCQQRTEHPDDQQKSSLKS